MENRDWLHCTTLSETVDNTSPQGKVFLPDASYREMTEWSLPVERQREHESIVHELESDWRWPRIKKFVRGGFWRNFKRKYPETEEMYSRMMFVSRRLQEAEKNGDNNLLDQARDHLYRAQCNCAYWHGAFGGVYLPHLRNAIYHHLIIADNLLDQAVGTEAVCSVKAEDFNFDLSPEVRLSNNKLTGWISPTLGGHMYELDVRSIGHNLLATMDRRPESYHDKVRRGAGMGDDSAESIHDQIKFKQEGLDQMIVYDQTRCKSLVDHFWSTDSTHQDFVTGKNQQLGDFAEGAYELTLRRSPDRNQVLMSRHGFVDQVPVKITKGITLAAESNTLMVAYMLENLPQDRTFRFGIEFNFAGLPANIDDRHFKDATGQSLGHLGTELALSQCTNISLHDNWLGIDASLSWDQPGSLWTCPVATVNGSEGGFELVHQSVKATPNWIVQGDENGRWVVRIELTVNTRNHMSLESDAPQIAPLRVD